MAQLAIDPLINPKLRKPIGDFSISYFFKYSKGQMGITSLTIVKFQNCNHHYRWENVYFNNIQITQFWRCAQKSLILQNGSHIIPIHFHFHQLNPWIMSKYLCSMLRKLNSNVVIRIADSALCKPWCKSAKPCGNILDMIPHQAPNRNCLIGITRKLA